MANFGPFGAKIAVLGLAALALRFQWFQPNLVDFGNPVFLENRGATPKNTKMRMGTAPQINFGIFSETPILTFVWKFESANVKTPFFPQFLAFLHIAKNASLTPNRTQKAVPYIKIKNVFSTTSFSAWCPKMTPDISRTRYDKWCGVHPHEAL